MLSTKGTSAREVEAASLEEARAAEKLGLSDGGGSEPPKKLQDKSASRRTTQDSVLLGVVAGGSTASLGSRATERVGISGGETEKRRICGRRNALLLGVLATAFPIVVGCLALAARGHFGLLPARPAKSKAPPPGIAWPSEYAVAGTHMPQRYSGQYFDMISEPLSLKYGEVHFKDVAPIPLPPDVRALFKDRPVGITGYECQVVERVAGEERPVPATELYNHHFILSLVSKGQSTRLPHRAGMAPPPEDYFTGPGRKSYDEARVRAGEAEPPLPRHQAIFSESNGGEARGSYHGYPKGYAQLLYSPDAMSNFYHNINTRNPDPSRPAPLPRSSPTPPGAAYSGLLECPCSTRRTFNLSEGTIDGKKQSFNCGGELAKQQNPSCSLATYTGGLRCCEHGDVLLDADQNPSPWPSSQFYWKVRWYYTLDTAGVKNLFRLYWMTEHSNSEYDLLPCSPGTIPEECVHTLVDIITAESLFTHCDIATNGWCADIDLLTDRGFELIYAGGHQHAPSAISFELIDADTGKLLCRNEPVFGTGSSAWNETGYLLSIPPCVWGHDEGLPPPPVIKKETRLMSIAKYNNTYKHNGVMSLWQMRGAYL